MKLKADTTLLSDLNVSGNTTLNNGTTAFSSLHVSGTTQWLFLKIKSVWNLHYMLVDSGGITNFHDEFNVNYILDQFW